MAKSITYTQASNGSGVEARAESRQATARAFCAGNDSRGGLLGRMAGAVSGGSVRGPTGKQNAGSMSFQEMQAAHFATCGNDDQTWME